MGGYKTAGYEMAWMLAKLACFIVLTFIFSYIFWTTKEMVEKYGKKRRK